MKLHFHLGIFLSLLLLVAIIPGNSVPTETISDGTGDNRQTIEVEDLVISVPTAQVPFYHYWLNEDPSTIYRLHFDTMFEINDLNDNSQYDQYNDSVVPQSVTPLSQMTWEMSEVTNSTGTVSFNLTGTVTGENPLVNSDLIVQFRNHITTIDGNTELKFDVAIANYEWMSDTALLVLGFKLDVTDATYSGIPQTLQTQLTTQAQFGKGYLESVQDAYTGTDGQYKHQIQSRLTVGNTTALEQDTHPRIFITYEHFTGDLLHDPSIGIDQSDRTFVADSLSVKVPTNQLPFYFFWRSDSDDPTYRVAFDTVFEVADSNNNGAFDETEQLIPNSVYPLALLDWEMSDIVNTTEGTASYYHFNLTGSPGSSPQAGDTIISFSNHIKIDGNSSEIKFDININNYQWQNDSDTTLLVLGYKITTTNEQYTGSPELNGSQAVFGNAYMETVQTALMNNGTDHQVNVAMSIGAGSRVDAEDSDARIYLAYSHFDGNLTHDPTLGLLSESTDDTSPDQSDTGDDGTSADEIALITVPVLAVLVLIPLVNRKWKSSKR